jgi:hypothetical protein
VIWDKNNNAVSKPQYLYPEGNYLSISLMYIVDEPSLVTDQYRLVATAFNGKKSTSVYRNIRIIGIDREFEKALFFCQPNSLKTYLYAINTSLESSTILTIDKSYQVSAINSSQRKLFYADQPPSTLSVYDLDDLVENEWISASPPYASFTDILAAENITYLSSGNGDLKGLDHYGNVNFVTPTNLDTLARILHDHYNYIIAYCEHRIGSGASIRQYFKASGVFRVSKGISAEIVAMSSIDENACLLFGNKEGVGIIYNYAPQDNALLERKSIAEGLIKDIETLAEGEYLIATTAGLYRYSYGSNSIFEWYPGLEVDFLQFEEMKNIIWAASGQMVFIIDLSSAEIINELQLPYVILSMHLQYSI